MSTLDDWTDTPCPELRLDPADVSQESVLNLAKVAAHTVDRSAAPLTGPSFQPSFPCPVRPDLAH